MKSIYNKNKAKSIEEVNNIKKQVPKLGKEGYPDIKCEGIVDALQEKHLKTIFDMLPVGVSILDEKQNILYVNYELERILGIFKYDLLKSNCKNQKYLRPDGSPMPVEEFASAKALKKQRVIHNVETGVVKKDGSVIWTSKSAIPVAFQQGKVLVITSAITNHKRTDESLQKSTAKLSGLKDSTNEGFILFDAKLNFIKMNNAAQKITGINKKAVIGKNILDIIPEVKGSGRYDKYKEVIETGEPFFFYNLIFPYEFGGENVEHKAFKVGDGMGIIFSNIKKQNWRNKTAKQTEKKYSILFNEDISGDYVVTPSGKFLYCNRAFVKMFGFSSMEEVYKTNASALYEKKENRQKFLQQLNKNKKLNLYEHNLVRKDGNIITVLENTVGKFNDNGKLVQIGGYIVDITERKQMEEELRNSLLQLRNLASHLQTIREEERAKIARNIHDDMGQILTTLKISLSLIESEIQSGKKPIEQLDILGELKDMQNIVGVAMTKARELIRELRPEILDNLGLLEALKWQAGEFENQNKIKCLFSSNVKSIVLDMNKTTAIFRIFQEVLTNILHHAKAKTVKINLNKINGKLVLGIKDDGIGFSKKKIFDPNSLGLLGMKERTFVFKGDLEIITDKGKGTTVTLSIPIN